MIEIRPAIDLLDGKCVRLRQGNYEERSEYSEDPIEAALKFEQAGFTSLHLVDLEGARSGSPVHWKILERICRITKLAVDFGGGIRERQSVERAFAAGARQVCIGSIAATKPEVLVRWGQDFGPERFILAADVRRDRVAIHGWSEDSEMQLDEFLGPLRAGGFRWLMCTDIERDGCLQGAAVSLYRQIRAAHPGLKLIASGGVSSLDDIRALEAEGVDVAVVGKALYEKLYLLEEAASYGRAANYSLP